MRDTTMSDLWEDIRISFVRQGWRHLAEAAEEVRQTWLVREAGLADVTFQGNPLFPPGPFTGVYTPATDQQ